MSPRKMFSTPTTTAFIDRTEKKGILIHALNLHGYFHVSYHAAVLYP